LAGTVYDTDYDDNNNLIGLAKWKEVSELVWKMCTQQILNQYEIHFESGLRILSKLF